jgi:hypothetical protein
MLNVGSASNHKFSDPAPELIRIIQDRAGDLKLKFLRNTVSDSLPSTPEFGVTISLRKK